MTERLHFPFSLSGIGEGNGNPLQCSYLENPRDRGAGWAAVYGVALSRTRLKRLSSSSMSYSLRLYGCSLQGSSVHVRLLARTLEWVAMSLPEDLPNPGIEPAAPALQADSLPLSHQGSPDMYTPLDIK